MPGKVESIGGKRGLCKSFFVICFSKCYNFHRVKFSASGITGIWKAIGSVGKPRLNFWHINVDQVGYGPGDGNVDKVVFLG